MDPFIILVLTHFVSDWFFQPTPWAIKKVKYFRPRLYHAIQYSVIFLPVLYFLNLSLLWVFWIFITHLLLDDYKLVKWWSKVIKRGTSKTHPSWINVIQDQVLHVLVLIPVVVI